MATIITEEELQRKREEAELNKQILADEMARVAALKDIQTVKETFTDLDNQQASALAAGAEAQEKIQALMVRQNELRERGQQLSDVESRELRYQMDLRDDALSSMGDQKKFLEAIIEETDRLNGEIKTTSSNIKDAEKAQKEFKDKVDQGVKSLDTLKGIASSISPQLGNLVSNAQSLATGFAAASLAAGPLGGALFLAQEAAQGLLAASVKLSEILAAGVRESGLVDFEQMLYDNVAATNQFGMSAAETGKLLSGLSQNFSGFALASSEVQDAVVEQAAALDALGVSSADSGKLFETLTRGLGMGAEGIEQVGTEFANLGRSIGKSTQAIVSDFNAMQGSLAQFGSSSIEVFKEVQEASTRLGISAEKMMGVFDATTTFEGAASMAGKLNGVLGTTVDAMELINAESPAETIDILRGSLMDAGQSFDEMTLQQRRFLAETTGIDMPTLQKMLSGDELPPKSPMEVSLESLAKTAMDVEKFITTQFNKMFNALAESGVLAEIESAIKAVFAEGGPFSFFVGVVTPAAVVLGKIFAGIVTPFKQVAQLFTVISEFLSPMVEMFKEMTAELEKHAKILTIMDVTFKTIGAFIGGVLVAKLAVAGARMGVLLVKTIGKAIAAIYGSLAQIPFGVGLLGVAAAVGGLYAAISGASGAVPADDYSSQPTTGGGYGDRMLMDKGELIAFNNDDTIIAGTNIQMANDAMSSAANQKTTTQANNAAAAAQPQPAASAPQAQGQPTKVVLEIDRIKLGEVLMGTDGVVSGPLGISG